MKILSLIEFIRENNDTLHEYPDFLDTASTLLIKAKREKRKYKDWEPHGEYSDKQSDAMKEMMDKGYSHREAEYIAGASKVPKDLHGAMKSDVKSSMPSEKMMDHMKGLAKHWLGNADRDAQINADQKKNPVQHAAGKMLQAHEGHEKDYMKAYHDFLGSDNVKDLKGKARHTAVKEWKTDWKQENPSYEEGRSDLSNTQGAYKESQEVAKRTLEDTLNHITAGGQQDKIFSDAEGAQIAGGTSKGEEGGFTSSVVKDPLANFAQQNPAFVAKLKEARGKTDSDIHERYKGTMSAKTAQQSPEAPEAPKVIRRKRNAD